MRAIIPEHLLVQCDICDQDATKIFTKGITPEMFVVRITRRYCHDESLLEEIRGLDVCFNCVDKTSLRVMLNIGRAEPSPL